MKNKIFTSFSMFLTIFYCADAQTWQGSTSSTGLTYRDGDVVIGGTSVSGSFGSGKVLQLQNGITGGTTWLSMTSAGSTVSCNLALLPTLGVGLYARELPIFFYTSAPGAPFLERMRITEGGNVGIGFTDPAFTLDVNGSIWASSYQGPSDLRLKQNLKKITGSLDKISQISGYTYSFNHDKFKDRNFPKGEQMGVLAQEMQKIFPHSVMQDSEGYLSVNYMSLIPVMVEAIKDLKAQVDEMRLNQLASTVLKNNVEDAKQYRGAYLNQNTPNPFNSKTSIAYTIPDNAYSASIFVHDLNGKQVKRIEIPHRGTGSIDIASEDLPPGFYLYSLVLDGKPIITRKMIQGN